MSFHLGMFMEIYLILRSFILMIMMEIYYIVCQLFIPTLLLKKTLLYLCKKLYYLLNHKARDFIFLSSVWKKSFTTKRI